MHSLTSAGRSRGSTAALRRAEPLVRFALAFLLLNLPHWLLGQWLFISRPWFNVELIVPLLLATVSRPLAMLTLTILWLLDLGVSQSFTYHFSSPLEFVRSLSFLRNVQVFDFVSVSNVGLLAPFALCAAGGLGLLLQKPLAWRPAASLAMFLAFVDIANGSSMFWQRPTWVVPANPTGSPVLTLLVKAWKGRNPAALRPLPSRSAVDAAALPAWAASHPDGSILLVIVESMGWCNDARLNAWLRGQLFDAALATHFDLSERQIPFAGSTTSAELRELCGLVGSYRRLLEPAAEADCLPTRLARQGWTTVGVHGFSGHMFDRTDWWPRLGLQRRLFAEDLLGPGDDRCGGAFAGACDADVVEGALREARLPRHFVYMLTLNSHLPLAAMPVPDDLRDICAQSNAGPDVCLLTATIGKALAAVRDGLKSVRSELAVVVVGDHAPPLSNLRDRAMYDESRVAAFVLKPRP